MTLQMALLEERLEGELQGEERGRAQGIELGRNAEREAVAIKLIRMGLNLSDIQKATNLPVQQLEELAKDNHNREGMTL